MANRVKVTMLGVSGSGKTSFMTCMYGMMSWGDSLKGFLLTSEDTAQSQKLLAAWEDLMDEDGREWPASTAGETATYEFNLNHGTSPIIGFDWMDYRGGAIKDRNVNAPDFIELQDRLKASSSIFICVSGERLATPIKSADVARIGVTNINNLLVNTFNPGSNNPPALVIVITKYDKCSHRSKAEIVADVKRLFPSWFAEQSGWLVLICPVTLGANLSENELLGEIEPSGLHVPVIFSLAAELSRQNRTTFDSQQVRIANLSQLKSSFISRLFKRSEIDSREMDLNRMDAKIKIVNKDLDNLFNILSSDTQVTLCFNGKESTFGEIFDV